VEAEPGTTILEAATVEGIKIPTLCYHKALLPDGACRLCLVEVGGRPRLAASCAHPVQEGIEVKTDSPRVLRARRLVSELLFLRCPEVPRVREMAREFGADLDGLGRFTPDDERCILCGLCVRMCKERMGVNAIDFMHRGSKRTVSPPFDRRSSVCLACGACASVCPLLTHQVATVSEREPVAIPSEYDAGLVSRGSVYIPFAQAIPKVPVIDRETCLYFQRGVCKTCELFCGPGAIDYEQEDEYSEIDVGAVVLATGYEVIDPGVKKELGFGRYPNVVSSLQFERMLSASGPDLGTVLRPSDRKPPDRIAFIQCVGSREIDHNYCSSVCCMQATKEAIIVKEHASETECTIFYIDIRAFGKGYEAYFQQAKSEGVRYIRCRPSAIKEAPDSRNLLLQFELSNGSVRHEEFDLVVLSVGMQATKEARELAAGFGVTLDDHGFARTCAMEPAQTDREGVFVAGVLSGPKDIPESVMEASAAASRAMSLLAEARGTQIGEREYPPERSVAGEEPRLGVFVCHCGRNIGGVVNVAAVVEYARGLPGVVHAEENLYTCSTDSQVRIRQMIKEHGLNRVIVASCTPRTHEPLFRDTVREAGLNPYLFEMANIRDQCSWVHMHEPQQATAKAKDLVRMAVTKAAMLESLYGGTVEVRPRALVLGGGLAGMTAALELGNQGFETYLLEKSDSLGGNFRRVHVYSDGVDPQAKLAELVDQITSHPGVHVYTKAELDQLDGAVGNFRSRFTTNGESHEIEHGAVIVATGGQEYQATEYLRGQHPAAITQLELEERLVNGDFLADSVVMLQCIGFCGEPNGYCSRLCCPQAVKTALEIRKQSPETSVFIVHKDIRTYGFHEARYREARENGVRFIRMAEDTEPEVVARNGRLEVSVLDEVLRAKLIIQADLLVLSTGVVAGEGNKELAQKLKVPLNQDGFFLEAHMKLRPVEFATEGIFLCGLAHSPKTAEESIAQARASAARAATILSKSSLQLEAAISDVVDENCDGCAYCVEPCPYQAITLIEYATDGTVKKTVDSDPAKCRGCGVCQATCPKKGILIRNFSLDQLSAMVEAALTS
jgi:heterodisulfide reductase subunit A